MTQHTNPEAVVKKLRELEAKATPGPWEFRHGHDRHGDSCDLLMVEVGKAGPDEDPEYAEVLFGANELGDVQVSANWELVRLMRNNLPAILSGLEEGQKGFGANKPHDRCLNTGNKCGTDTRPDGWTCPCGPCQLHAALADRDRLARELEEVRSRSAQLEHQQKINTITIATLTKERDEARHSKMDWELACSRRELEINNLQRQITQLQADKEFLDWLKKTAPATMEVWAGTFRRERKADAAILAEKEKTNG